MSRTALFDKWLRAVRIGNYCDQQGMSTREGLDRLAYGAAQYHVTRRRFLTTLGKFAAAGAAATILDPVSRGFAAPPLRPQVSVGIVGAGLAGLACANELKRNGID